jgi:NADH dehydrogenase
MNGGDMSADGADGRERVVVVGGGFAGYHAAKGLSRRLGDRVEIALVNPTDYFLYLPLLPEVSSGLLDPRRVTVSIPATLPHVRLVLGTVDTVDLAGRRVAYLNPEGERGELSYDRLLLATGSVNKLLPIPGVGEYAHGFRNIAEALYLRDHIVRQVELADSTDDPAEREARLNFIVVGAGYTGTEVAAQGVLFTDALLARHPRLAGHRARWLLCDMAPRVLPGLDEHLSSAADRVLRERGVDVRTETSVSEAKPGGVLLSDDSELATHTLIWCVGVRPEPVVEGLGLETKQGRLVVDKYLTIPDYPDAFACGDVAAVPDLTAPGEVTAMTAQHAQRQGARAAKNIAASLGKGRRRAYKHHDLGFVVDLGGTQAAANPLKLPLDGLVAKAVTRGYHLFALPSNRVRTALDWLSEALLSRQTVQLGLVRSGDVPLDVDTAEGGQKPTLQAAKPVSEAAGKSSGQQPVSAQ